MKVYGFMVVSYRQTFQAQIQSIIIISQFCMDGKGTKKSKKKVANFIIDFTKQLGVGQYGKVYEAVEQETNHTVAVKMIDKQAIYDDDYTKNALIREIEIMKNLKSPNIIQFIDIQETANNIYIFQQLASDGTLHQVLRKSKRLQQQVALDYVMQMLTGFSELIKHGIIHRDIKPTNILMKGNVIKLADFGLSRYSDTMTSMVSAVGTPVYMAPQVMYIEDEQASKYTYKCDIWSFGVVCYELITGGIPWKNIQKCQLKELFAKIKQQSLAGIKFPSQIQISDDFKDLIRGCLKFEEKDRYDWSQIFHHKIFKNKFKEINAKTNTRIQENFTLTEIRLKVHSGNVNLQKFMSKMPQKLTKQDFFNLMKTLHDKITENQANNLFQLFAHGANQISQKIFLDNLEQHGIKLKGLRGKPNAEGPNIQKTIQTLTKKIQEKEIDVFQSLKKIQVKKKNVLDKEEFGKFIHSISPDTSAEQIDELFKFFNPEDKKGIGFASLYEKLCKAIQVPAVKDQNIAKELKKIQEKKKN